MVSIDLREIFQYARTYERSFTLAGKDVDLPREAGIVSEPVEVAIRIEKDSDGYTVHLNISAKVDLTCSRCLSSFTKDMVLSSKKHVEHYPFNENLELSASDLDVSFIDREKLILEELVREEILLNLSMKPLCKPDCGGVHPGIILQEESNTSPKDPRFAILKNLLD